MEAILVGAIVGVTVIITASMITDAIKAHTIAVKDYRDKVELERERDRYRDALWQIAHRDKSPTEVCGEDTGGYRMKREFKPAGIKATITLPFWIPGVSTIHEARDIITRALKIQSQEGDYLVLLAGMEEQYRVIEEHSANKMNLPRRDK